MAPDHAQVIPSNETELADLKCSVPRERTRYYASVRSCARGLQILEFVNVYRCIHLKDLVRECGLPRATVIRLLETLVEEGFVKENIEHGTFEPAPRVLNLASGFHFENWLDTISRTVLLELLGKIAWPSDLLFLYGDRMQARASNRAYCTAQIINRSYTDVGGPLSNSASGRAYLAWCPDPELNRLLQQIAGIHEHKDIRQELKMTKQRGYAVRNPALEPKMGAISVPVMFKRSVMCVLTCTYIYGTTSNDAIAAKCLEPLQDAAKLIERAFQDSFGTVHINNLVAG
jgi:IclR family mhp operon transcriptional activator